MQELIDTYSWFLPAAIFLGRICDVSLGTLRIVFVSRGEKKIAPIIGFIEVFIWVVIIAQVLTQANDLISFLAYAGGYAAGTYIGLFIEQKIGFGVIKYRVFTMQKGHALAMQLKEAGFGATIIHGEGSVSEIDIVESIVRRQHAKKIENVIEEFDPKAFVLVEDIRGKQQGVFLKRQSLFFANRK